MTKQKDRPRLGRGLASLISVTEKHPKTQVVVPAAPPVQAPPVVLAAPPAPPVQLAGGRPMDVPVTAISPNPHQPRRTFGDVALKELADSMRANGVIQPIIVRPVGEGKYQLVAGERRWRAAQIADLKEIPAIVREMDALTQAQLAMIENIQREDLNPIERAMGYEVLIKELGLTQAELALRLGEDRSSIANFLRLLELTEPVKEMVRAGKLSTGHAKILAGIDDVLEQHKLAELVVAQGLSVRNLERIISQRAEGAKLRGPRVPLSPHLADIEKTLCRHLNLRVQLRASRERGKGRIVMHYSNLDQFDEIMDRLGINLANE